MDFSGIPHHKFLLRGWRQSARINDSVLFFMRATFLSANNDFSSSRIWLRETPGTLDRDLPKLISFFHPFEGSVFFLILEIPPPRILYSTLTLFLGPPCVGGDVLSAQTVVRFCGRSSILTFFLGFGVF